MKREISFLLKIILVLVSIFFFLFLLFGLIYNYLFPSTPEMTLVKESFACEDGSLLVYKGTHESHSMGSEFNIERLYFNDKELEIDSFPRNVTKPDELLIKKLSNFEFDINTSNLYLDPTHFSQQDFSVLANCVSKYESAIVAASGLFDKKLNETRTPNAAQSNSLLVLNSVIYGDTGIPPDRGTGHRQDSSFSTKTFSCPKENQFLRVYADGLVLFSGDTKTADETGYTNVDTNEIYRGESIDLKGGETGAMYSTFFHDFEGQKSALSECTYEGQNFYQHFNLSESILLKAQRGIFKQEST